MKRFLFPPLMAMLVLVLSVSLMAEDPGERDTVKISGGPLVVGRSIPITLTIVNDEVLSAYTLPLILSQVTGGFARYDSVVYINRMADPRILMDRIVALLADEVTPDTLHLGGIALGASLRFPVGNTPILRLYLTGLSEGEMAIDSGFRPPAGTFVLAAPYPVGSFSPEFVTQSMTVLTGTIPPAIASPSDAQRVVAGNPLEFDVSGSSPEGFPVSLTLSRLVGFDDETRTPASAPALSAGNPASFGWTPTTADIGVWSAVFAACDSAGACVSANVEIQVVSSASYLVSFLITETPNVANGTGLLHGSFDSDPAPELLLTGTAYYSTAPVEVYDYQSTNHLERVFDSDGQQTLPACGPQLGFFDSDGLLDVVYMRLGGEPKLVVMAGDGSNGFTINDQVAGDWSRRSALGEFTGDNHLDVVCENLDRDTIIVFAGDGLGSFTRAAATTINDSVFSLNCADFNDDGRDDLAVGTKSGVSIYLGDGTGEFSLANSYSQTYESSDIAVTNQGSDFNDDDQYDLCISTPSVAGAFSEMMVYLGNGDGSFAQHSVRTAKGQIFGNAVGDFNNDGRLDIAYANGALRYVAILFGDGDGNFANEIRYHIPFPNPQYIDALDIDLDGDLDLAVVANEMDPSNSLFLLTNQSNPGGFAQSAVNVSAHDNVKLELQSSSGLVLNDVRSTMPAASLYKRNLDQNSIIDNFAVLGIAEPAEYTLVAEPRPDLPAGQPFSIEFKRDNALYRLAKDLPSSASGLKFGVYLGEQSLVAPRPGSFISVNPPTFGWSESGDHDFQLATDVGFTNPIVSRQVTGQTLSLASPLPATDTAIYYWRIKPHSSSEYGSTYVFNLVEAASPGCGDANGDGMIDIGDAVSVIGYIFNGGELHNLSAADTNCDSSVDISDAVLLINYVFGGGVAPCEGC
jgi:hypothetical protein